MKPDYEIVLGRGIGEILLGLPKQELADILGEPNEIEYPEDPEKTDRETWCYDVIKCSFSFDPDHDDRLVEILVENGYFHIGKKIRVGIKKEDLLKFGKELQFGKCVIEDRRSDEYPSHELIFYEQVGLHLWLDRGILSAIQISPLVNEHGRIIWPLPDSV
jgi:hypothetical protein